MRPNVKFFCSLHLTAVISVVRKPYWTLITSQLAIRIFDAQNKHTRDKWKLRRTPVLQPRRNAYLQLVWITLCKLAKINSRAGTLNQEVIQITVSYCSQRNVFFPLQSAGFIQISGGLHTVCAWECVKARLWKQLHILLSPMEALDFVRVERGNRFKKKQKTKSKNWGNFNTVQVIGLPGFMGDFRHEFS